MLKVKCSADWRLRPHPGAEPGAAEPPVDALVNMGAGKVVGVPLGKRPCGSPARPRLQSPGLALRGRRHGTVYLFCKNSSILALASARPAPVCSR